MKQPGSGVWQIMNSVICGNNNSVQMIIDIIKETDTSCTVNKIITKIKFKFVIVILQARKKGKGYPIAKMNTIPDFQMQYQLNSGKTTI